MRRCWKRNADVHVTVYEQHTPTLERLDLYHQYVNRRHRNHQANGSMTGAPDEFLEFLVSSPLPGPSCAEFRVGGELLGVSVFDVLPDSLSAVYCYYNCNHMKRAPGIFNILWLIRHANSQGKRYVYLGYWIEGCPRMEYKARFLPHERWSPGDVWQRIDKHAQMPQ